MKKVIGVLMCLLLVTGCATSHLKNGEESVVTFKDGGISAQDLYEKLKEENGFNALTILIDTELLEKEYGDKDKADENKYIDQVVSSLKDQWKDDFSRNIETYYGVKTESALREYIRLTYRRNLWTDDYAKTQVNDTQIDEYYNNHYVGDMKLSHILISSTATDSMSADEKTAAENEAYNRAVEVINRLNKGENFADLAKELSGDNANKDNGGYLGDNINDRTSYDENFLDAAIKLEVGKYSETPVKSYAGYHIIFKESQKDKPSLDSAKEDIITKIANDMVSADSTFNTKAIKALREKYELKVTDTDLKSEYVDTFGE